MVLGLATLLVAALMLTVTGDVKRMLAYSSMENMGLIAIAAAVGTTLAIAALLLHVLAHGVGKTVLFLAGGQMQVAHGTHRNRRHHRRRTALAADRRLVRARVDRAARECPRSRCSPVSWPSRDRWLMPGWRGCWPRRCC